MGVAGWLLPDGAEQPDWSSSKAPRTETVMAVMARLLGTLSPPAPVPPVPAAGSCAVLKTCGRPNQFPRRAARAAAA